MNIETNLGLISENSIVLIRLETLFGFTNTWWKIKFIDIDGTFIGSLEEFDRFEYKQHKKHDHVRFKVSQIQDILKDKQQICASSFSICSCIGLCHNK